MPEIDAEVKKWGNTLGIRVPAAVAHDAGIGAGDEVHVTIEKVNRPNPQFVGLAKRGGWNLDIDAYTARRDRERREEREREGRKGRTAAQPRARKPR